MADILSVVIGGALAIAGGLAPRLWESRRQRRALAHALAGEVSAIIDIVERRRYQEGVRELIRAVETSHQPLFLRVPITQNYFVVYEANSVNVGLLPRKTARDVASFYTHAKALIEDVTTDKVLPKTEAEAIHRLKQMDELLTRLLTLGSGVVMELEGV